MRAFLFSWNAKKNPHSIPEKVSADPWFNWWSCGRRMDLPEGSRFFLMRVGVEARGIIGSGWTTSEPYERRVSESEGGLWKETGEEYYCVNINFEFISEKLVIPLKILLQAPFNDFNWSQRASGIEIPAKIAAMLETEWSNRITGHLSEPQYAEEIPSDGSYPEGAVKKISINAYERSERARRACINHFGPNCLVCGFSFCDTFPGISKVENYIHVHHLRMLSEIDDIYQVDPVKDLIPVCPNCHAALHLKDPPYTPEELAQLRKK